MDKVIISDPARVVSLSVNTSIADSLFKAVVQVTEILHSTNPLKKIFALAVINFFESMSLQDVEALSTHSGPLGCHVENSFSSYITAPVHVLELSVG